MSEKINIKEKPYGCKAWTPKDSDKVMCNTMPCCGFCVGKGMQEAIRKDGSFPSNKRH